MKSTIHLKSLGLLCLLCLIPLWAFSQQISVQGIVKDAAGESIIGASVVEKGTTNGTITDFDGNFNLNVPADAVLTISFVGYQSQDIPVSGKTSFNITLKEDTEVLDEVVVVGYGVQKKKLVTGATVQVKGEDLQKLNTVSPLGALQSQSPGVNITQSSGMPGEGYKVNVRGMGTIGSSAPLYVIDGVAGGDINMLNPSDIESIDVLKDAASAAIYGARAANGVILVTTRQGKTGKVQVSYDGYYGIQQIAKNADLLNAKQYMEIMDRKDGAYDWASLLPTQLYNSIMDGTWNGTDWMKEATNKNAPTQNHSLNMAGGNEYSRFSLGLSYTSQEGTIGKPVQPDYERYTARLNSDHVILKNDDFDVIKFGENMSYSYTERSGIGIGNIYWNDVHNFLTANPLLPVYNSEGDYYDYDDKTNEGWTFDPNAANPIASMVYQRGKNLRRNHALRGNFYLEIQPIKNLKYKSSFGYRYDAYTYRSYTDVFHLSSDTQNTNDKVSQEAGISMAWTWENTLTYSFNQNGHALDAVIGQSMEKWGIGETLSATNANSLFPGDFDYAYLTNTQGISSSMTTVSGAPQTAGRLASFFGRANYNYQEKYMLSATLRADGSSNFARGHRWGIFPSFSAGWVMTNEPFMESVTNWMDFLKIRASWGQNGNSDIANFQYLSSIAFDSQNSYVFGTDKITQSTGAYANILPNENVSWETSEQLDLGIDARFFRSRLGVAFDYYYKKTKDWLVQAPILASYGTGAPYINGGDVMNKGFEVALNWNDMIQDFRYGVNFNLSYNKNEVTRIANTEGIIHGPSDVLTALSGGEIYRAQVGYPIGYFWGYKTAGVFQNQAQVDATKAKLATAAPGELIFVDVNGDGKITNADKTMIGDPNPDFRMGFSINLGYKGFDFSLTTNGAFGHQIVKSYRQYLASSKQNFTKDIYECWNGEGTSNRMPSIKNLETSESWKNFSDIFVEDGNYLRAQNITLGYDFKQLFPKMPLQQARLYVSVLNAFTITSYSGMDPEVGSSGNDSYSWASGIDLGFYPSPRTYMFGVNLKF